MKPANDRGKPIVEVVRLVLRDPTGGVLATHRTAGKNRLAIQLSPKRSQPMTSPQHLETRGA